MDSSKYSGEVSDESGTASACTRETIPEEKTEEESSETAAEALETEKETKEIAEVGACKAGTSEADTKAKDDTEQSTGEAKAGTRSAESKDSGTEKTINGSVKCKREEERCAEDTEKLFSAAVLERLLGLLGAILPRDSKVNTMMTK